MAASKPFPAYADETIELFDVISVSAGQRGLQLILAPADYLRATEATLADLTKAAPMNTAPCPDHLRKDLRIEWRSRDSINGMLFFALLVVVVFSLAFDPPRPSPARSPAASSGWQFFSPPSPP